MSHLVPVLHHPVYSPFISLLEFKAIHGRGGYCGKVYYRGTYWKGVSLVDADNGIEVLVTFIKPLIRILTTK